MKWLEALTRLGATREAHVLVTLLEIRGSAPRNAGTKMLVSKNATFDTVGGGQMEFEIIRHARELLANPLPGGKTTPATPLIRDFNLARDVAQCCGGTVQVLFECFQPGYSPLVLCGAGHVGQALLTILDELPVNVTVFDSRQEWLGQVNAGALTEAVPLTEPHRQIEQCQTSSVYLVMTHSHDLDFELCEAILSRPDRPWCGLIASRSKAASFTRRLARKGFTATELARLTTPVGLPEVAGKEPMAVAVSIAGQLLALPAFNYTLVSDDAAPDLCTQDLPRARLLNNTE